MLLINSPVCQKPVSEAANSCPCCGFPLTSDVVAAQKVTKQKADQADKIATMVVFNIFAVFVAIILLMFFMPSWLSSPPPRSEVTTDYASEPPAAPVSNERYYRDGDGAIISETETENKIAQIRGRLASMPDKLERAYLEGVLQAVESEWVRIKRQGPIDPMQVDNVKGSQTVNDDAPLSEPQRQKIFYDLVASQDAGTGDREAYRLIAKKYHLPEDTILAIGYEGAANRTSLRLPSGRTILQYQHLCDRFQYRPPTRLTRVVWRSRFVAVV